MERHGVCVRASGRIEKVTINDYSDMGQYVGGYLEALPIDEGKHGVSVFINEEGLINELPINMPACLWLSAHKMWPVLDSPVHGDVLVMGATSVEGETPSIPEDIDFPRLLKEPKFEVYGFNEGVE